MGNSSLRRARKAKDDEFYTQLCDIESELQHYTKHFKGATVYCNCDDPSKSNFVRYFRDNFTRLGVKRLIATCFVDQDHDLLSDKPKVKAMYIDCDASTIGNPEIKELQGDGDFRSDECIEFLRKADIVVTNPPFSLFRQYLWQLMDEGRRFLVLGNLNQIVSKGVCNLVADGSVNVGQSMGQMQFERPDQNQHTIGPCCWYTNLQYKRHYPEVEHTNTYNPKDYPRYVNYNAIEVSRFADMPIDYEGKMGVPISAIDKLNPDQFEIFGFDKQLARHIRHYSKSEKWTCGFYIKKHSNLKPIYSRIVIRNKHARATKAA